MPFSVLFVCTPPPHELKRLIEERIAKVKHEQTTLDLQNEDQQFEFGVNRLILDVLHQHLADLQQEFPETDADARRQRFYQSYLRPGSARLQPRRRRFRVIWFRRSYPSRQFLPTLQLTRRDSSPNNRAQLSSTFHRNKIPLNRN